MNTAKKLTGIAIASAAAAMFLTGCESMYGSKADTKAATVHCMGVNACKGQTACNTANNACKGQNSCKGTGWLPMTKEECAEKGGTVS